MEFLPPACMRRGEGGGEEKDFLEFLFLKWHAQSIGILRISYSMHIFNKKSGGKDSPVFGFLCLSGKGRQTRTEEYARAPDQTIR